MFATVGGHGCVARAFVFVASSPRRHAVAPLAARLACSHAHLVPFRLAAPVLTLGLAVCSIHLIKNTKKKCIKDFG